MPMVAIVVVARAMLVPAVMMAAIPAVVPARTVAIDGVMAMAPVPAMGPSLRFRAGAGEGEAGDKRQQ